MVIKQALSVGGKILKNAHIGSWIADSRILLCFSLNCSKSRLPLIENEQMPEEAERLFFDCIEKRKNKMPVKYITGSCEFMGIDFIIDKGVLIPRPDTEILVEEVISKFQNKNNLKILDLCCGSGCIGLSLASFLNCSCVLLADISDIAIDVTRKNISKLGFDDYAAVIKKDILNESIEGEFDIIVSNPPYISDSDYENLMDDVRLYEPKLALNSPGDEYLFYKKIIKDYFINIKKDGYIFFEVGYNQADRVAEILRQASQYDDIHITKDYSGIKRVVSAGIKS